MHESDADRGEHRDDAGADVEVRAAQIGDDDAGERRVGDPVADERELAENYVGAHRRTQEPDRQRRHEGSLHERVVKRNGQRVEAHERISGCAACAACGS